MRLYHFSPGAREFIRRCLFEAADGPYFPDWEFQTLFGLERSQVRSVARDWPPSNEDDATVCDAIGGALDNLCGYPHGFEKRLEELERATGFEVGTVREEWFKPDDRGVPEQIVLDLTRVSTARELHVVASRALRFPHPYGHNWDAFGAAIMKLVEMPRQLTLIGWSDFSGRLPRDAEALRECLDEMQKFGYVNCCVQYQ